MSRRRADEGEVKTEARPGGRLVEPTLSALDALDVDSIAVGFCRDVRPLAGLLGMLDWRLCGRLSQLLEAGTIIGAVDEKVLFPTGGRVGSPRIFLYGWGTRAEAKAQAAEHLKGMIEMLDKAKVERVAVGFPEPARELVHLARDVEDGLGSRLAALFGPDPLPPI